MPKERNIADLGSLLQYLEKDGNLKNMKEILSIYKETQFMSEFFKLAMRAGPVGPQRSWIVRLAKGESFSIIAPPGLGKTTFGIISSVYFATKKQKRSLLMFPTKTLVNQVKQKIQEVAVNTSSNIKLLVYDSSMKQSQRSEFMKSLQAEDFDIALLSSRFAMMNLHTLTTLDFGFLFVDDVDSALKSNKSAMAVTMLAGYSEEDISRVKELLRISYRDPSAFSKIAELRRKDKIVVFSSATVNRSNPVLSSLMGFKPGSSNIYLRKVIDSFTNLPENENLIVKKVKEIITRLGTGGLIFVPIDKGNKYAEQLAKELDGEKRVVSLSSSSVKKIDQFKNGDIDVMVGVATHYGVLVRGIDIPCRIKYAIFVGIPKFKFSIGETIHPLTALKLLTLIAQVKKDSSISSMLYKAKRRLRRASSASLSMIARDVKDGKSIDTVLKDMYSTLYDNLKDEIVLEKISEIGDVVVRGKSIMMPDYVTYIQASGRTSRLFGSELTTGLSLVMIDDQRLFSMLQKKLSFILDENNWYEFDLDSGKIGEKSLSQVMSDIDRERKEISVARSGGYLENSISKIKTTLLIVESPHKAKTISGFFSRPTVRETNGIRVFETVIGDKVLMVTASIGHVYDLTTEDRGLYGVEVKESSRGNQEFVPYYTTIKRCENGHQFTTDKEGVCPRCGGRVVSDKKVVINGLRKLVMEADSVLIGTDPDTEGEKIAWDLYVALKPYNRNIKRAEFHEVTRRAIVNAINNPREFMIPLVKSQIVRRVEDRWIGFKLSYVLRDFFWKSYCNKLNEKKSTSYLKEICNKNEPYYNLSAGRVQTPVLNWIVNRYLNEYKKNAKKILVISLDKFNFTVIKEKGIKIGDSVNVNVNNVEISEETFGPLPPYTTDSLLSDSSQLLGISAQESMSVAQDLFESGLITYHRTDSTRISNVGISVAENYLKQLLGVLPEEFKPRGWGEGGAHEAIRPTKPMDSDQLYTAIESGDIEPSKQFKRQHFRIYELIFKRFISSQLNPIIVKRVKLHLNAETKGINLSLDPTEVNLPFSVLVSNNKEVDSKLRDKVYVPFRIYNEVEVYVKGIMGKTVEGKITREFIKSEKPLYTEGDLVTEMKNKGIGRPSTYATIVNTLLRRGYVIESKKIKRLIPSNLGIAVNDYLNSNYGNFVGEERTRQLLSKMDKVERGEINYTDLLNELYKEIQLIDRVKEKNNGD